MSRHGYRLSGCLAVCALAATLAATWSPAAFAQEAKKGPAPTPSSGTGWDSKVAAEQSVAGVTLDAQQTEVVKKVNDYFNSLENMKGQFIQTTADNKRLKGKFFMKRPGRIRFEYAPPSRQLIISDGSQISIQDRDINTDDRVMVDQTPFRVLLRKDVDLIRDAQILEVQQADDLLIVALKDKGRDNTGKVRLFLASKPAIELREWVTTDAQGLDTRLEVSSLDKSQEIDAELFKIVAPALKTNQ